MDRMMHLFVSTVLVSLLLLAAPVQAGLACRVIDGDSLACGSERIRIMGLDAPELRGRCAGEIAQAERAKARLTALLAGARLQLVDVHHGKYAGRVVARVLTEDGRDVAATLLAENLVRAYRGGRREGWCVAAPG